MSSLRSDDVTDQQVIHALSTQNHGLQGAIIGPIDIARPLILSSSYISTSPLGILDSLPVELLTFVVRNLDFDSLAKFSTTCQRANELVQSMKAYRDVTFYAWRALTTLARVNILSRHSLDKIDCVLQSRTCASCGNGFAPFLLVMTFERACISCLRNNQALWVLPATMAERCFGLTQRGLRGQLPRMTSIPGIYNLATPQLRRTPLKLVSAREAKVMAVKAYGSEAALAEHAPSPRPGPRAEELQELYSHYLATPTEPLAYDPLTIPDGDQEMDGHRDPYFGMATIRLPALTDRGLEHGVWCRGCERDMEHKRLELIVRLRQHAQTVPPEELDEVRRQWRIAKSMRYAAYARQDFLEHVRGCTTARRLSPDLESWFVKHELRA